MEPHRRTAGLLSPSQSSSLPPFFSSKNTGYSSKLRALVRRVPALRGLVRTTLLLLLAYLIGVFYPISWDPSPPPFLVKPEEFLPPPPLPVTPWYPLSDSLEEQDKIPNVVHYVFGYKASSNGQGEILPYYAYLAIRSALVSLKPEKIYFHYQHLPRGPFWDLLEPHLTLLQTPAVDSIYGRPLKHFAHKSDVIRLQALQATGGIYLDIDIFVIKPFTPLLPFSTVLSMESSPDSRRGPLDPAGLCNAVILSRKDSRFLSRWIGSYETFDGDASWAGHSVEKPWELARRYPKEITVLNERAMFWPLWEGANEESRIRYVHEETAHDFEKTGQFAYHAWESLAMGYLGNLSPKLIKEKDSSFNRMVRKFVTDDDQVAYEKWQEMTS